MPAPGRAVEARNGQPCEVPNADLSARPVVVAVTRPAGRVFAGMVGERVSAVRVVFDGETIELPLTALPAAFSGSYATFLFIAPLSASTFRFDMVDASGAELAMEGFNFESAPGQFTSNPVPLEASGSGNGRTPSFTGDSGTTISITYAGTAPIRIDRVCGEERVTVLSHRAPGGALDTVVGGEPARDATCYFDVGAEGPWSIAVR